MARTALEMDIADLARLANLSTNTIVRFERGEHLKSATIAQIQAALEFAGVIFIPENGGGAGVRFTKPRSQTIRTG